MTMKEPSQDLDIESLDLTREPTAKGVAVRIWAVKNRVWVETWQMGPGHGVGGSLVWRQQLRSRTQGEPWTRLLAEHLADVVCDRDAWGWPELRS